MIHNERGKIIYNVPIPHLGERNQTNVQQKDLYNGLLTHDFQRKTCCVS